MPIRGDAGFAGVVVSKPTRPSASLAMSKRGHAGFAGVADLHRGTASGAFCTRRNFPRLGNNSRG
jgi:hypothetical protein